MLISSLDVQGLDRRDPHALDPEQYCQSGHQEDETDRTCQAVRSRHRLYDKNQLC